MPVAAAILSLAAERWCLVIDTENSEEGDRQGEATVGINIKQ